MYYIGIDCGGTKTSINVFTEVKKVDSLDFSTGHIQQLGETKFEDFIIQIKNSLKEYMKNEYFITFGMAGYGKSSTDKIIITDIIQKHFDPKKYDLISDAELALMGSLGLCDGISIISGTGSIGLAKFDNKISICGGWGYVIGDEGSAYNIGLKTLSTFSKQADGRMNKTYLYDVLKKELNFEKDYDLVGIINSKYKNDRTKIASISKITYKAANGGCINCINIFRNAAIELYELISLLSSKTNQNEIRVSYNGGVFKAGDFVLKHLKLECEKSDKNIVLSKPLLSPVNGGVLNSYYKINGDKKIMFLLEKDE